MLSIIIKKTVFDLLINRHKHYLRNCHNVKVFLKHEGNIFIHCDYDGFSFGEKTRFLSEKGIPYLTKFLNEEESDLIKIKGTHVEMGFVSN